jgi:YegS/Rv2252/BmrU family lipid kinase
MDIAFIVNPRSGAGSGFSHLREFFAAGALGEGASVGRYRVLASQVPGEARLLSRRCVDDGFDLVVAVGGDGTVNEVAAALVGTRTRLGIVPLGSGNGLARALGIPLSPLAAMRQLATAKCVLMDVGRCGDRFFLSTAGVGVDAEVAYTYMKYFGAVRGRSPYFLLTAMKVLLYRPSEIVLESEALTYQGAPFLLSLCNTTQFGCGAIISPKAKYDDGLLDICILEKIRYRAMPGYVHSLFEGSIDQTPGMRIAHARKVLLLSKKPIKLQLDGESLQVDSPVELGVVPSALHVLIPSPSRRG